MGRKFVLLAFVSVFFLPSMLVLLFLSSFAVGPGTINVPGDYPTIQAAINAADPGDTISVSSGVYSENVVVNKSLTLIGAGPSTTVIDGNGTGTVVTVVADYVNLSGFTIRNGEKDGVRLDIFGHSNISGNNVTNNGWNGIYLRYSDDNTISGNTITSNTDGEVAPNNGIYLYSSGNNTVSGNTITENEDNGISLDSSENNTITCNNIKSNHYYGIYQYYSDYNTISGNNITENLEGICLHSSGNNSITSNAVSSNTNRGIILSVSSGTDIGSGNNTLSGNVIANNYRGIYLGYHSDNNSIQHNNFINNTEQAYSYKSVSTWDDDYPSGGNYWSDYTGVDLYSGPHQNETGSDGFGDTPYMINANNTDNYPLMAPWPWPIKNVETNLYYITIQRAINVPETLDGHTILVGAGTYYEHVTMNKSLTLVGKGLGTSVIDGNGTETVVTVTADDVNISGFTIQNGGSSWPDSGILLDRSNGSSLHDNTVMNNGYGIYLNYSNDNTLGLNNIINNNRDGIVLFSSGGNTLRGNHIAGNGNNFVVHGESLADYIQDIDDSNAVNGKPICFWVNQQDRQVPADAGYVAIINSTNITVEDLNLAKNGQGVLFVRTTNSFIENVSVTNNLDAIFLRWSNNNTLSNNDLTSNAKGLHLGFSGNNTVRGNAITNNDYGIYLNSSDSSTLYHNNIVNNTNQAYNYLSNNTWDDGYPSGGNYWSDYAGLDLHSGSYQNVTGSDGFGDTPYIIDGNNEDNYPLMGPWPWQIKNVETGIYYLTIQRAIDAPETLDSHTILVGAGTYYEHVTVNKSLTLVGEDPSTTIIDENGTGTAMNITANDVKVRGFTTQNCFWGVKVYGSNCRISGNTMMNVLLLENGGNNTVNGNNLTTIDCNNVTDNNIYSNFISRARLYHSRNNTITNNTITGSSFEGVYLLNSSDCIITQNTITNTSGDGICFEYCRNGTISGNTITNVQHTPWLGIRLLHSDFITVNGNNISRNRGGGIGLESSSFITVSGNNMNNNVLGVSALSSGNNTISGNTINSNAYGGIGLRGSSNNTISDNIITNCQATDDAAAISLKDYSGNNRISGNTITNNAWMGIYIRTYLDHGNNIVSDNTITDNVVGIYLHYSRNDTISGNTLTNNAWIGICLESSGNNTVTRNAVTDNEYGMHLFLSSNNTISRNNITLSASDGLYLSDSPNNIIIDNSIANNQLHGINLESSNDNTIYHNNFIDNTRQARSSASTNTWDDGYPSGGNYWSDYTGADLYSGPHQNERGSDGLGDTPYVIDANNQDNYPLMNLWMIPNGPTADFTYSPLRPVEDETITFNASTSMPGWNGTHPVPIVNYTWNFGDDTPLITETIPVATHNYTAVGTYTVTLNITDSQGLWDTVSKTITTIYPHDVAIISVTPAQTVVGQGYKCEIDVIAENQGNFTETFNVTAYANTTIIATLTNITITAGDSTTLTFTWNTTGVAIGNYTIKAEATQVIGEIDLADNTLIDGWVIVTWLGDFDGDEDIDIDDIRYFCAAYIDYWSTPSVKDPLCDFDDDCDIDIDDIRTFCTAYIDYWTP